MFSKKGFNLNLIEKTINQIEFNLKNKNQEDFSQNVMLNVIEYYINDNIEMEFFKVRENIRKLK